MTVAGWYGWRAWQQGLKRRAGAFAGSIAAILVVYGAWPGSWYGMNMWETVTKSGTNGQTFYWGWIWYAPNSNPFTTYYKYGDQPWYVEYHWRGLELLAGNAYVFGGLLAFAGLVLAATIPAWRARTRPSPAS
jgi:hypothetical protein